MCWKYLSLPLRQWYVHSFVIFSRHHQIKTKALHHFHGFIQEIQLQWVSLICIIPSTWFTSKQIQSWGTSIRCLNDVDVHLLEGLWWYCPLGLWRKRANKVELIGAWETWIGFYTSNFQVKFSDWWLGHLLQNSSPMNVSDLINDKSTVVQVMAWCLQATSHYLSQCWPRSRSPYGITRPQWVKENNPKFFSHYVRPCLT